MYRPEKNGGQTPHLRARLLPWGPQGAGAGAAAGTRVQLPLGGLLRAGAQWQARLPALLCSGAGRDRGRDTGPLGRRPPRCPRGEGHVSLSQIALEELGPGGRPAKWIQGTGHRHQSDANSGCADEAGGKDRGCRGASGDTAGLRAQGVSPSEPPESKTPGARVWPPANASSRPPAGSHWGSQPPPDLGQ